jgi:hypothetical protein
MRIMMVMIMMINVEATKIQVAAVMDYSASSPSRSHMEMIFCGIVTAV